MTFSLELNQVQAHKSQTSGYAYLLEVICHPLLLEVGELLLLLRLSVRGTGKARAEREGEADRWGCKVTKSSRYESEHGHQRGRERVSEMQSVTCPIVTGGLLTYPCVVCASSSRGSDGSAPSSVRRRSTRSGRTPPRKGRSVDRLLSDGSNVGHDGRKGWEMGERGE